MPDFPSRADDAFPPVGDSALDELLTPGQPPQDAAAGLQLVAAMLAALRAGPADGELAGQDRALAEFRGMVGVSHRAGRGRRPGPFSERLRSKLAVLTAAAAVAVSGTAAAAYAGALPRPFQRAAHDVIAAPEADGAHGHRAPAAVRAHPFPTRYAAAPSPFTRYPGWRYGQSGVAREHGRDKRHGHHKRHRGRAAAPHEGMPGSRHDGPPARPNDHPMTHHQGSRLQSPLPRAAAFPIPPAGPDRSASGR